MHALALIGLRELKYIIIEHDPRALCVCGFYAVEAPFYKFNSKLGCTCSLIAATLVFLSGRSLVPLLFIIWLVRINDFQDSFPRLVRRRDLANGFYPWRYISLK